MELISVEMARVVHLFMARRMVGQLYAPNAMAALVKKYQFAKFPTKLEDMADPPIRLGHGLFQDTAIEQIEIFSDGLGVTAKSPSDVLDAFIVDLLAWSKDTLGLDRIETHKASRIYESQLVFRTDRNILRVMSPLERIADDISQALQQASNMEAKYHNSGIMLSADSSTIAGFKPISFKVERHPALEFSQNLFLSQAPLPTKAHWAILRQMVQSD